jgi:hypothetical protein
MPVGLDAPSRIESHQNIGETGLVEDMSTDSALGRLLRPILRDNDDRLRRWFEAGGIDYLRT